MHNTISAKIAPWAILAIAITGCGGGGGGGNKKPDTDSTSLTGVFVDSPVGGVSYVSRNSNNVTTHQGITNAAGEYDYEEGDTVTFSIGGITFPPAPAKPTVTPLDIVGTGDINHPAVINIARLLQSLDVDGDPTNGITITASIRNAAASMTLDTLQAFSSNTFENDVNDFLEDLGETLVSEQEAIDHLSDSLDDVDDSVPGDVFTTDWLAEKTLYNVWFGEGEDAQGNPLNNVAVVQKIEFGIDGVATVTGLLNSGSGTVDYSVDENGMLHSTDDPTSGNTIVCGSTADYIKTHYTLDGELDNVDLFFFNQADALAYAATLTASIAPCDDEESPEPEPTGTLIGSWFLGNTAIADNAIVFTFIDDTRYMMAENGVGNQTGFDGMEYGTYAWNEESSSFTATQIVDTNGDWGASHFTGTLTVSGDTLTFTDGNPSAFARIASDTNALVGSWYAENAGQAESTVVLTFINDTHYMIAQDGDSELDPSGQDGIEFGEYTWDSSTNAITSTVVTETDLEWGLGNNTAQDGVTASVSGDTLTIGDTTFTRIQ